MTLILASLWMPVAMTDPGSIPTGGNILSLDFLFSHSKASDASIGIIFNFI